ncbi:Transposon Ty3-G Gag-Pol polyprotein [Hordeum vulgare]|nr:Transposon Ty3-G Gag-Pol polyprotein [Hordeum vulgare]
MEQLEKRMDVAEQQIKETREDLNRIFDELVEMIRKRGKEYDDVLEEPDLYAYRSVPNPTYAKDTYKAKAEIPTFNGNIDIEGCLDWLYEVETFFEVMEVSEDCRIPLVAYKLKRGADAWWCHVQAEHMNAERRTSCENLATNEKSFKRGVLRADCDQILFIRFQNCSQGNRTVSDYTWEFLRLQVNCNLAETKYQQVAMYINVLNDVIQDQPMMQQI